MGEIPVTRRDRRWSAYGAVLHRHASADLREGDSLAGRLVAAVGQVLRTAPGSKLHRDALDDLAGVVEVWREQVEPF